MDDSMLTASGDAESMPPLFIHRNHAFLSKWVGKHATP
jgi:hypothetical protein